MSALAGTNFSYMWTEPLGQGFEKLAAMGVARAELTVSLPHVDLTRPIATLTAEINAEKAAAGIELTSLNPVELNMISPNPALANTSQEQYLRTIELAAGVGAPVVVVIPGRFNSLCPMDPTVAFEMFNRRLETLLEHAEQHGVGLALENAPFGFLQTPSDLAKEVQAIGHPRLGLTVDAANIHFVGADLTAEVQAARDNIFIAHISDTTTKKFAHAHMGDGDVDFMAFGAALKNIGYTGDTVYELVTPGVDWERWEQDFTTLRQIGWH